MLVEIKEDIDDITNAYEEDESDENVDEEESDMEIIIE